MSEHTVVDLLPKDAIPSIDDPTFDTAFDGDPEEEVIVVGGADSTRVYPTRILQNHEVVNGAIDGGEIAVTWCPLCASAVVYDRLLDGETLTFGVSGKLADNDLVLYDRETGSEWKQSSGHCLSGPHAGETLTVLPAATMTWASVGPVSRRRGAPAARVGNRSVRDRPVRRVHAHRLRRPRR